MPIGFSVACEVDCGVRTPGPVSTRSADTIIVDASNLHENAGKSHEHRGNPSRNEEDDRNRNADPFPPQAIKPTVGVPEILVLRRFEMAPSRKAGECELSGGVDFGFDSESAIVFSGETWVTSTSRTQR